MLPSPGLPRFDYVRAATPGDVVDLLQEHGEAARLLMGGTDLFVRMRDGFIRPRVVVDVKYLPGMGDIVYDERTGLVVGAAATMNQAARHPDVLAHFPLLAAAVSSAASYQLRNRATVGGNLCNASPCADTTPAALVLEGQVALHGPDGEREIPLRDFFRGPGETVMGKEEFMTAARFPLPPAGAVGRYLKLGRNRIGDLAIVSVAVLGLPDETAVSGYRFRIALGAVAPVVLRAVESEEMLAADPPGDESFAAAAELAVAAAAPIDDVRASAAYRKAMVRALTLRAFRGVWEELRAR